MNPYTTKPKDLKPSVKKDSPELFKSPLAASRKYAIFTRGQINTSSTGITAAEGGGSLGGLVSITKNNGVWENIINNPYATGIKGSLVSKTYVPRNFNTTNPTGLFKSPLAASRKYAILTQGQINTSSTGIIAAEGGGSLGGLVSVTKNEGVWENTLK